ncbi:hypothetical protein [Streptomyces sp. NBC_00658]|uniref:hypothetical protein n=1 Tax=Streptomyces sp. NBC_00658 TaxID=2975800 RepID=UPI003245FCEE
MDPMRWYEKDPLEQEDENRLGDLYETLLNHLHFRPERDDFITVVSSALQAEFDYRAAGVYPPLGHTYPRLAD